MTLLKEQKGSGRIFCHLDSETGVASTLSISNVHGMLSSFTGQWNNMKQWPDPVSQVHTVLHIKRLHGYVIKMSVAVAWQGLLSERHIFPMQIKADTESHH